MHAPAPGRHTPLTSYRLQLHAGFTFADVAARLDYLDALGVTDLYLSPILAAAPGSTHGYDVVDPTRISADLGGRDGFERLATAAHARGLGVIVDIVPNHMAIPDPLTANPALWSVLRDGAASPFAGWFDIEDGAPLILPALPGDAPDLLAAGRLAYGTLAGTPEPVITLDGSPYPLAPGTAHLPLEVALERQHYRLVRWQGIHTPLTHRRFFDIVNLIGVRQERPEVFDATHALLLELARAGHIDGFRVDHPDGLADPQAYFERLREATGGAWVVAEKILTGDELLPTTWPVAGTTGYEAAWRFDAVQLDPDAAHPLAALAQETDDPSRPPASSLRAPTPRAASSESRELRSEPLHAESRSPAHYKRSWAEVETEAKREIASTTLAVDVERLLPLVRAAEPGHPVGDEDLLVCLREFLVALDRYRAYVRPGWEPDGEASRVLADAAARAAAALPERLGPAVEWLHRLVSGTTAGFVHRTRETNPAAGAGTEVSTAAHERSAAARELVVRFQQVTGALMAKGVEDTAFYRWTQLLTLCDVGGDPGTFGLTPDELHRWLATVNAGWPATMSLGSSHDSKRSEDVRARIAVLSEYPAEWAELVTRLAPAAAGLPGPIRTLWWQTLAGSWTDAGPIESERLAGFLIKAGREQKLWTSWFSPDPAAEAEAARLVPGIVADPGVRNAFDGWVRLVADSVRTNTLAAKLVQLTALGVADLYEGCETVRLSLTDPDNRRPVDFDALEALLDGDAARQSSRTPSAPPAHTPATVAGLAAEKLLLTTSALQLRRRHPEAFVGAAAGYRPLTSSSRFAWGFARGTDPAAATIATRLTRARRAAGGWTASDAVALPVGTWLNLLTGGRHTGGFPLASGLGGWPCALLERIR